MAPPRSPRRPTTPGARRPGDASTPPGDRDAARPPHRVSTVEPGRDGPAHAASSQPAPTGHVTPLLARRPDRCPMPRTAGPASPCRTTESRRSTGHHPAVPAPDAIPEAELVASAGRNHASTPSSSTTASSESCRCYWVAPPTCRRCCTTPDSAHAVEPRHRPHRDGPAAGHHGDGRLRNRVLNLLSQKVILREPHTAPPTRCWRRSGRTASRSPARRRRAGRPVDRADGAQLRVPAQRPPAQRAVRRCRAPTAVRRLLRPRWWAELDDDRPVVHVTQGTVDNTICPA